MDRTGEAAEFGTQFSEQRLRVASRAARALTSSNGRPEAHETDGQLREVSALLVTSLEELKVAEEQLLAQHEAMEATGAELARELERLRTLFQLAPAALRLTDLQGSIREVNRAAAALLRADPYYLERKPIATLVPRAERAAFRAGLGRLSITAGASNWEFTVDRHGEQPIRVLAAVHVVPDPRRGSALYWLLRPASGRAAD